MKKTILLTLLIISSGHIVHAQCKPFNPITYDKYGIVKNMTKSECQALFRRKPHARDAKIDELNALLAEHGRSDRVTVSNFDAYYWDTCQTVTADYFDYPILYDGEDRYGNICIAAQPRKSYRGETVQMLPIAKKPVGSNACGNTAKNPRTARVLMNKPKKPLQQLSQESPLERVQTTSHVTKEVTTEELPRVITGVTSQQPDQAIPVSEELPRVITSTAGTTNTTAPATESYSVPKSSPQVHMSQTEHVPSEYTPQKHDMEEVSEPIEPVYDEPRVTTRNEPAPCRVSKCKPKKARVVTISNGQSICVTDKCNRTTKVIVN